MLKRPSQAHAVVVVVQVSRARAFGLLWVSAEMERGLRQRHIRRACLRICALIHQNLVPIKLKICHQPNAPRSRRQLACQVHHDGALESGGKTYIVRNPLPFAVRHLRFNIRRDWLHAGLPRRIQRGRTEVIHIPRHQQPQRSTRSNLTQVQRERVQIGKPIERQRCKPARKLVIPPAQLVQHVNLVDALPDPRAHRQPRAL